MTPANTAPSSNVFAGILLCKDNFAPVNEIAAKVFWPEATKLLRYAT